MSEWDMEYIEEELQPFIEFDRNGTGVFQFGHIYGEMDCQLTQRDGKPAVEFSWEGNDEEDHVCKQLISIARKIAKSLSEALDIDAPPSPNPR